jgi:hypothetical protein
MASPLAPRIALVTHPAQLVTRGSPPAAICCAAAGRLTTLCQQPSLPTQPVHRSDPFTR